MRVKPRGLLGVASLCALLGACEHFVPVPPAPAIIEADAATVVDDRQIVTLARTTTSADALASEALQHGYTVEARERLDGLGLVMIVFRTPPTLRGQAAIRHLEGLETGISAGLNHAYDLRERQVGRGRAYADEVLGWPRTGCRSGFPVIGMLDAAVDTGSPGLAGAEITVRDFTAGARGPARTDHGTETAVILAGQGRLSNVRILNAAVIGDHAQRGSTGSVDNMLRGLSWLQASGARLVNVSLEGPYNRLLDRGVQAALARGMIIVAAVGNNGPSSPPRYPAAFPGVIGVTAIDVSRAVYPAAAMGGHVDFAAPGVDVFLPIGERGRYISGTSVAAPYITALIASGANADLPSAVVVANLSRSAVDLGRRGNDPIFGLGAPRLQGACGRFTP
jgi:hypothetical protein